MCVQPTGGEAALMLCTFSSARAMAALRFAFALSAGAAAPPSASCMHSVPSAITQRPHDTAVPQGITGITSAMRPCTRRQLRSGA
jgi:hypothetical protein